MLGTYAHARSAELGKAVARLKVPGTTAGPLAALDREQLEGVVFGLCVLLGNFLSSEPNWPAPVTLRVTPRVGISGDRRGQNALSERRRENEESPATAGLSSGEGGIQVAAFRNLIPCRQLSN